LIIIFIAYCDNNTKVYIKISKPMPIPVSL